MMAPISDASKTTREPINFVAAAVTVVVCLAAAEIVLRLLGFYSVDELVKPVAQLEVVRSFVGSPDGLFVANSKFRDWPDEVHVNSHGFRTPEFDETQGHGPSLALIGDSFTWGSGAEPLTNSFADLLRSLNLRVYNFGIPGVGPTQYKAIAEKYVPALLPDYVIVFLYLGNDLKERPDPVEPFRPLFHVTNAGWIWAWDEDGSYLDSHQAYEYYVKGASFRQKMRDLVYHTAAGTLVWQGLRQIRDRLRTWSAGTAALDGQAWTYTFQTLMDIQTVVEKHGKRFVLVPIPNGGYACGNRLINEFMNAPSFFNVLEVDLGDDRFFHPYPNCHLTNEGHAQVFRAIAKWLN